MKRSLPLATWARSTSPSADYMSAHKRKRASKSSRQGRRSLSEAQNLSPTAHYERNCKLTGGPSPSGSPARRREAQEPLTDLTEQLDSPSILKSDGFLQDVLQTVLQTNFDMIGKESAQHEVNFRIACRLCRIVDLMLGYIKRPTFTLPEAIYMERYLPDGSFKIDSETSKIFGMKCIQASEQCAPFILSVESLVGFADVLRTIMQPVVEAYFSGTLQLDPPASVRNERFTVDSLGREERARLSTAFFNTLVLVMKDEVTTGSLCDLLLAIDRVLRSKGIVKPFVKREELRNESEHFKRESLPWSLEMDVLEFEVGSMTMALLELTGENLNYRLSGYLE